ncbi:MAG: hypothetical protein IK020_08125 [Clostridiales bacterium]|nr:hypothetical protein [Clostridiales bacterium]
MITRLRRLFRRENRMHKRPLVTAITVLVIFVFAATLLFANLGLIRKSSDYPTVKVADVTSGVIASGLGVNLSFLPSTNLVLDPSFENRSVESVCRVAEASGNNVYLHSDPSAEEDDMSIYTGGQLRIMSYDEEGRMNELVNAGILDYQVRQLGIWKSVDIESSVNPDADIILSKDGYTVLLLKDGSLLCDVTSKEPVQVVPDKEEDPYIALSLGNTCHYAVTRSGSFAASANGHTWSPVSYSLEGQEIYAVASLGKLGVACGTNGAVLVCDMENVSVPALNTNCNLNTAISDEHRVLLAGDQGKVFTTSNGTVFRALSEEELETKQTDTWMLSDFSGEEFILVGQHGQIAIGRYDESSDRFRFDRYSTALPESISPRQLAVFPSGEVWVLTDNGYLYAFSREKSSWQQVFVQKDNQVEAMSTASGGSIFLARAGKLYSATVYTKVTIDQPIGEVEIQNGDMCLMTAQVPSVGSRGDSAWEVFGQGTTAQIAYGGAKMYGERALQLSSMLADENEAHIVSQIISRDEVGPLEEKVFYHIRLSLRQSGLQTEQAMVWLSGLSEPIGTTFSNISGNWKEYSFTFVWPKNQYDHKEDVRLNIGFYGQGDLYVDAVTLEKEAYSEPQVEPQLVRALEDASPEFLRLDNLRLGRVGMDISSNLTQIGNEIMYSDSVAGENNSGIISLETSLRLVKSIDAKPWVVIDSAFSADEMNAILGYLCGGITDDYGKIRIDNGTAVPWQKQFDRIVFEISDGNGLFETDLQRRAYVDYLILLISNSPYYPDIKDSIFFLDGMHYDNGTVLSSADFHTTALSINNQGEDQTLIEGKENLNAMLERVYQDFVDAIPRNPSYSQDAYGEWISDLSFSMVSSRVYENQILLDEMPLNAAEIIKFLLEDMGNHTSFVAVDLPVSSLSVDGDEDYFFSREKDSLQNRKVNTENAEILLRTVGVITKYAQGTRNEVEWVVPLSHVNDSDYAITLDSYAFTQEGYTYLIIVNRTEEQQQFMIDSRASSRDIEVHRYSLECKEIALAASGGLLQLADRRYTLQSGQFCIAIIPIE